MATPHRKTLKTLRIDAFLKRPRTSVPRHPPLPSQNEVLLQRYATGKHGFLTWSRGPIFLPPRSACVMLVNGTNAKGGGSFSMSVLRREPDMRRSTLYSA